ncbi:MAG: FadR/GntR family transcriptional regulator [Deltaproteobacteria bacterium]|nr:FadR/GntR family transcriptional regulator [Deltaproteobacteria bacterium]
MDFQPIQAKKIYEEVVEQIRQLMENGTLKPGDKLLSERELAEKLQVSRASVREALRALEMMGFVEIKAGGGTFIKETSGDEIIQPLAMFLSIEKGSFFEIYEIRKIFEIAAAHLAAQRATPVDLAKIEENLEKMKAALTDDDSEKGEDSDAAFHFSIAEATQNSWLLRLLNTISDSFHKSISVARRQLYLTPGYPQLLMDQHTKIYEAIRDRNPNLAQKVMLEHLSFAEDAMAKTLKIEPEFQLLT